MIKQTICVSDVLLVMDMQYDFMSGGALAVTAADELVMLINDIMPKFETIVFTQDWHPKAHVSFAESHVGKKVFENTTVDYGLQELWPVHCQSGTRGAELHKDLLTDRATMILRKGCRVNVDSYSAFFEKDGSPTGLAAFLQARSLKRVFICGLAMDFCVRYTAEDAVRCGFETFLFKDLCRAVNISGSLQDAYNSMTTLGVKYV